MKQEEKDLLLKDLCARLLYGVVVATTDNDGTLPNFWTLDSYNRLTEDVFITNCELNADRLTYFCDVRPYLFPLSSMTKEQKEEYCALQQKVIYNSKGLINSDVMEYVNWCYKNHIDINNLIPKRLARDATNLNIY